MKRRLLVFLLLSLWVSAQEAVFSDYVVGSAEGVDAAVTFYLQNVSPCFLEEVALRVSHDAVYYTTDERTLVVNLAPGEVGTFVVLLSRGLSEGWAWTVDSVRVAAQGGACQQGGLVNFERIAFGEAGAAVQTPDSPVQGEVEYTVKTGDSLWRIAREHGTTVDAILQANGRSDTLLSVGETLSIPATSQAIPAADFPLYTVETGDTLWDLAQQFSTEVSLIQAANCLDEGAALRVGDQLSIPPLDADLKALQQACR